MTPGADISSLFVEDIKVRSGYPTSKTPFTNVTELSPSPSPLPEHTLPSDTLVLNPAFISQDFDLLRFEAAAFDQLPAAKLLESPKEDTALTSSTSPVYSPFLISSPYNNPGHHLDLTTLANPSRLFAKSLTALKPLRPDYATAPYTDALNFDHVLSVLRNLAKTENVLLPATSFYVVTFRSKLNRGFDYDWLYKLDYESHREACQSGGLLKYWFGKADGERRNLATCIWHSRADAYAGGLGPWHKKARAAGRELYESIVFSTHRFTVLEGATGYVFEDWVE